ncbi:MAG: CubicO group peptidase (beta-lactamase class C family) [Enterobacterales bacterium]|jgi:CubicO group peptidase (beta-lactamase class C family)
MKIITTTPSYIIDKELNIGQHNWDDSEYLALGQISMEKLFKTIALEPSTKPLALPLAEKPLALDGMSFDDPLMKGRLISAEQLLNRRIYNDGLLVMHQGKLVHESYRNGMTATDRHVIHSCTKSLCSIIVRMAIEESLIVPEYEINTYLSEFKAHQAWDGVTVQHVLDMQAGIEYSEDYSDPQADYWQYARAAGYYPTLNDEKAIGVKAWTYENLTVRKDQPGSSFVYNSTLANVLGMVLENVYQKDLAEIFETKLYKKVGAESDAYFNTDIQGFAITEGQFNCRLRDFARLAFLMINQGKNLAGEQLFDPVFIDSMVKVDPSAQKAYQASSRDRAFSNGQYKNQFWGLNPDLKQFSMLGIHGQFAWFDLNKELMMVGVGSYPVQDGNLLMRALGTLWKTVSHSV